MFTTREGVSVSQNITQKVDLVMINFGLVDAWVTTLPHLYVRYYPDNIFKKYVRKLLKSIKKRLRAPFFQKYFSRGAVVSLDEYVGNIQKIIANIRRNSPNVKIVLWGIAPTPNDQDRDKLIARYDREVERLAVDCGGVYIDTRSLLEGHDMDALYFDGIHIKAAGFKYIVQDIYDKIFPL